MKRQLSLIVALSLACGMPVMFNSASAVGFTAVAQTQKATGTVTDASGEPLIGATVMVKGTTTGTTTDLDGKFSLNAKPGATLLVSYVGYAAKEVKYNGAPLSITLDNNSAELDEVVVTALGIKKDKKSLGYAIDDINAEELMRNKTSNAVNSLSGKIAGVNITQAGGAPGAGAQIILRGGTSLERDNQPLFVVDGVIYDNSTTVAGNSAFDGTQATSTTSSNRVMDINPEDIENMSVLKGPAAAALYGSRAANGVVIITTKKGQEGSVEVNLSAKYITQWATNVAQSQKKYGHGFWQDQYDKTSGAYTGTDYNDFAYTAWGKEIDGEVYDNINDFFKTGGAWDTNLSVAGGSKNNSFYLSGSYYDQDGIIPTTGYKKATFRFNGEQKWKIFTFGANVAYSQANTNKTLTSAGLYGNAGTGTLNGVFSWAPDMDMKHYLNEDGSRYRVFGDRLNPWDEKTNPYWILNKNQIKDNTERFTGNFNIKADITDWWWISYRMGIDSYLFTDQKTIGADGVNKQLWQKGMFAQNDYRHQYVSTNLMTNFSKTFGDFGFNLLLGLTTDDTRTSSNYRMAWNFTVPEFYSFSNATDNNKKFESTRTQKRLVGVYGEFRADWKNTIFLTVTGRNDWTSTLPLNNRSYFYPSVSGSVVFTEFLPKTDWLSFGRVRASWARVGKDTSPYATTTSLWAAQEMLGGFAGNAAYWQSGNPTLKPEISESTALGLELRLFNNRLKFDYAFYTNNSYNQIMSPRLSNATGYILRSVNAGDVYNKGMELSIGGTAIQTKDWTWETSINMAGNRGTVKNLMQGVDILYVTDVQVGSTKACSYPNGHFMSLSGTHWQYDDKGNVVLDKDNLPVKDTKTNVYVGNREPKFTGGWNNNLTWKDWSFSMLWEFRVGGMVYNGTQYAMTSAGISKLTEGRETLTITGVHKTDDGYTEPETYTFEADKSYTMGKTTVSGHNLIKSYYTDYYLYESNNWLTKVNSLRLRSISLSYSVPKAALAKTKCIKRAVITASASNLLLFTNYDGDPEVAVAGSGRTGSSSVGIDYCGVPSTASFAFGVNLTF
ncbi:MAG: SusC/RagA family TonB-linked outer membrane protein [Muribaculaceae bacterium]|nr:SusC/RagA family TonB-linked outer membrane protein [Muribaculaceae bacterium]